jgi:RNA-binding protein
VVHIGKGGIGEGVIAAVDQALETHELIKVRVGNAAPEGRHPVADALAAATRAEIAQVLGQSILLYRERAEKPAIRLPGLPRLASLAGAPTPQDGRTPSVAGALTPPDGRTPAGRDDGASAEDGEADADE